MDKIEEFTLQQVIDNQERVIKEQKEDIERLKQDISDLVYRLYSVKAHLLELSSITVGNVDRYAKSVVKDIKETINNISYKPMIYTLNAKSNESEE